MKKLYVAYIGRTCGGFSPLYTLMKFPPGDAYQSAMLSITSIDSWDMQGGSFLKINLYTRMMKWLENLAITP